MPSQTLSRRGTAALATVLIIGMGFSSLAGFAVGALAPFLVADLALTHPQLGSLVSVLFAVGAVLSAAVGSVVDRSEGRGVPAGGMLVAGLAPRRDGPRPGLLEAAPPRPPWAASRSRWEIR